jgi:hypothetical protein
MPDMTSASRAARPDAPFEAAMSPTLLDELSHVFAHEATDTDDDEEYVRLLVISIELRRRAKRWRVAKRELRRRARLR